MGLVAPSPRAEDEPMRRHLLAAVLAIGPILGTSCRAVSPPGVTLASQPPGARVVVDGYDSGFVTPCTLDLDASSLRQVRFELPGHRSEVRLLTHETSNWYVPWADGDVGIKTWRFPLWLSIGDLLVPIERRSGKLPTKVFVRLRPAEGQ